MMNGAKLKVTLMLAMAAVSLPAAAQTTTAAQNKLLAKRAAEADCYRKLAETVYGVQLNSETYVKDFITESDEIKTAVDTFVKGIRLGKPRWYDDGVCEVDAEVTVAKLVTTIKEVHSAHYRGRSVTTTDIEQIKQRIKKDVIQVTGMGAPRPELPPNLPEGIEDVIEPLPPQYIPPRMHVPDIWRQVTPQARLMAMRAARVDAQRKLLERIKGLRLTSDTLVRDFITEYDEISTKASGLVIGASEVETYLDDYDLIAYVTMEVPVERVISQLKELHTAHYKGRRVTSTDITQLKQRIERRVISATGTGVPRADFIKQAQKTANYEAPDWITFPIKVMGEGTDPAIETAQGRLKAIRAAEVDGLRKLAEQVYGLRVNSNTLVRDFVTEYDEISTQVDSMIAGATYGTPQVEMGVARVEVTLLGADVWQIIHRKMMVVERK